MTRYRFWGALIVLASLAAGAAAETLIVDSDLTIGSDDLTHDGWRIVVDGGVLTIDGTHTLAGLDVIGEGLVTHSPGARLHLLVPADPTPQGVTATAGSLVAIDAAQVPEVPLLPGGFESDAAIHVIAERSGQLASGPIEVDATDPGTYGHAWELDPGATVARAAAFATHLLHFDPASVHVLTGSVTFATEILGVIVTDARLDATDDLGSGELAYPAGLPGRGLDLAGRPDESFTISADRRTLSVVLRESSGIDQVRVLTRGVRDGVHIDASSAIDVSRRGSGPGEGGGGGQPGDLAGGGGGHGGRGGASSDGAKGGNVYGFAPEPTLAGSGGGSAGLVPGGAGGGTVWLTVDRTIAIDGRIDADGAGGGDSLAAGGGGAGGSILMQGDAIGGSGVISARGGPGGGIDRGGPAGGGGGGGRIAVYAADLGLLKDQFSVDGGPGHVTGDPGTLVFGTVVVQPDGSGDYPTIQDAADTVDEYTVVLLADGVFTGDGNRDIDPRGKDLIFASASGDPTACVIDCQGSLEEPHRGFHVHGDEPFRTRIANITIQNGDVRGLREAGAGGGILVEGGVSVVIEDVILINNRAANGGGGMHFQDAAARVSGAVFGFNASDNGGGGMHFVERAVGSLDDVILFANDGDAGGPGLYVGDDCVFDLRNVTICGNDGPGVALAAGARVTIDRSIIAFNTGTALTCDASQLTLRCSDVYGNDGGDFVGCLEGLDQDDAGGNSELGGSINLNPLFEDWPNGDFDLLPDSPALPQNSPCGELIGAAIEFPWSLPARRPAAATAAPQPAAASGLTLEANHPNPFNPSTTIRFTLPAAGPVSLAIYGLDGREVARLVAADLPAGGHTVTWDGRDTLGRDVAAGVYLYRLRTVSGDLSRTMVLLK